MSSRIADVFPHDNAEARFVVAMSIARNDIKHVMKRAGQANTDDDPAFGYLVRLAYGHLVEGVAALQRWRQHSSEVQRFLKTLPKTVTRDRAQAEACLKKVPNGALQHARHRTFHYPSPNPDRQPDFDSELQQVLKALGGKPATMMVANKDPSDIRLYFADDVALHLALGCHDADEAKARVETDAVIDGCGAFARFVDAALAAYLTDGYLRAEADVGPGC